MKAFWDTRFGWFLWLTVWSCRSSSWEQTLTFTRRHFGATTGVVCLRSDETKIKHFLGERWQHVWCKMEAECEGKQLIARCEMWRWIWSWVALVDWRHRDPFLALTYFSQYSGCRLACWMRFLQYDEPNVFFLKMTRWSFGFEFVFSEPVISLRMVLNILSVKILTDY